MKIEVADRPVGIFPEPSFASSMADPAWADLTNWERHEITAAWNDLDGCLRQLALRAAAELGTLREGHHPPALAFVADLAAKALVAGERLAVLRQGATHRWHVSAKGVEA